MSATPAQRRRGTEAEGKRGLLAIPVVVCGLIAVLLAIGFTLDDCTRKGWHFGVGWAPLRLLLLIDTALAGTVYTILSFGAGGTWHLLAKNGVVTQRSHAPVGTWILLGITAGIAGLSVLGARVSVVARASVVRRVAGLRKARIEEIASEAARHQTRDHTTRALPALLNWIRHSKVQLKNEVHSWAENKGLKPRTKKNLKTLVQVGDEESLLTLASLLCKHGGRKFLDDLIGRAPAASTQPATTASEAISVPPEESPI